MMLTSEISRSVAALLNRCIMTSEFTTLSDSPSEAMYSLTNTVVCLLSLQSVPEENLRAVF
jgi:hypothetical protein